MEHLVVRIFNKKLIIVSEGTSIVAVCFEAQPKFGYYSSHSNENKSSILLALVADQLDQYAKGKRKTFDARLLLKGTKFQKSVWSELKKIPSGKTASYLEIATNIARPRAYRAVANAVGKNPISIIIPCHRVIRQGGDLGGYTGGIDIKQLLLSNELGSKHRLIV
jgi:methylated-DNA-[protein]-cysteine S-methyltransferase